jgi:hypothetical protein
VRAESGKSLIAQAECARVLAAGGTAAYVDFESDAAPSSAASSTWAPPTTR